MACCALHNYLTETNWSSYSPPDSLDSENFDDGIIIQGSTSVDSPILDLDKKHPGNMINAAKKTKENFMNYFVNEGQVPWQNKFVH